MADVTDNGLRAAVKALTDVVAPSIDPTDPLAKEQLRLVVDYLQFVRSRLDFLHDRARFEMNHHLATARALQALGAPFSAENRDLLDATVSAGLQTQASVEASTVSVKEVSASLAAIARELVREAASFAPELRGPIERCVLLAADEIIRFERSWYLPLGFDPAPGDVVPLASLLANALPGAAERAC